ncbi:hypothetical protein TIFTF001_015360 [Ficus carica]|uniref:Retrotransposon gag domain-containing protein n=1 Tax=Ficus carica TaxID=3494 RepID=A0AA88D8W6_FICCA|nr:hypothetical protein TIFTF001_015360 [Ficus carica]
MGSCIGWNIHEYKCQFKEDLLAKCPYTLHQDDACHLRRDAFESEEGRHSSSRGIEGCISASSHVETPVPHQPEVVGDDDACIDPKEEDPTEIGRLGARDAESPRVACSAKSRTTPSSTVLAHPTALVIPIAQATQPVVWQEQLYEKFRRMKPSEFEGSTDPLEAEEWLISLQIVLNFIDLTEQEKVLCASYIMKKDARYWWKTMQMRRNNEFNNIKQSSMSVTEAIRKFNKLARLCPHLVPTEDERVRQILDMFLREIIVVINSSERPPTTIVECVGRALHAEYRLA